VQRGLQCRPGICKGSFAVLIAAKHGADPRIGAGLWS